MAFMIPYYTNGPFVRMVDAYGESCACPADVAGLQECYEIEETYSGKWFCHLSAPGYMDATEWSGPFDTIAQARQYIVDTFEVDPDSGDELEEEA